MPKLSIIVPVYNVEKYIKKSIDSILGQTFEDFELLLIDDGSPDHCPEICDMYAATDSRVKVFHQINRGVSAARNLGLNNATGEWISFVDSDDFLNVNTYEEIFCAIEETHCDIVAMEFAYVNECGEVIKEREYGKDEILDKKQMIEKQFDIPLSIRCAMSNKVIRRDILGECRFDESLRGSEDTLLLSECLYRIKKGYWLRKPLYQNVQRAGSAMHGGLGAQNLYETFHVHRRIAEKLRKIYPDLYDKAFAYYIDTCVWKMRSCMNSVKNADGDTRREVLNCVTKMKKHILNEWYGIIRCKEISFKLKLRYFLIGIGLN